QGQALVQLGRVAAGGQPQRGLATVVPRAPVPLPGRISEALDVIHPGGAVLLREGLQARQRRAGRDAVRRFHQAALSVSTARAAATSSGTNTTCTCRPGSARTVSRVRPGWRATRVAAS